MVGVSKATDKKHKDFKKILDTQITIVQAIFNKHSYLKNTFYYIELTAGSGYYEFDGQMVTGSPLLALELMASSKYRNMNFEFHLWEKKKRHFKTLTKQIYKYPEYNNISIYLYPESCEYACKKLANIYNKKSFYGLIFVDPNGYVVDNKTYITKPIIDILKSPKFNKMDILVNLSATSVKRRKDITLEKLLNQIPKLHWLIRDCTPNDKHQYSMSLFSNWPSLPKFRKLGFYNIKSSEGIEILYNLNSTNKEKER